MLKLFFSVIPTQTLIILTHKMKYCTYYQLSTSLNQIVSKLLDMASQLQTEVQLAL